QKVAHRLNSRVVGFNTDNKVRRIRPEDFIKYVAPQDLKSYGLIPEIIGRLPVITHLESLDREALLRVLTEPRNAITRQYEKLFAMDGVTLDFSSECLDYIVDKAVEFKLGARGLRSIVETIMVDAMFDVPSSGVKKYTVTREYAQQRVEAAHLEAASI
ncbi:MAG: ATP-dependent Clp protease ATP-binding subunit ClpX, partial [Muribaculaceae bacterium]|nr:ATP-dependent Clp protease ATP-binding subunit ClpX [Muribaculaceae bacterium]